MIFDDQTKLGHVLKHREARSVLFRHDPALEGQDYVLQFKKMMTLGDYTASLPEPARTAILRELAPLREQSEPATQKPRADYDEDGPDRAVAGRAGSRQSVCRRRARGRVHARWGGRDDRPRLL
ncbi:hypothetical protein [Paenibacillus sp. 1P07SE]|uniref:hypothetical protein n=1 Tax=Paenibacillus sp. 1P07SE TaxID=3132209 RepID=UPI0039A4E676